jgi:hypothetical protein
MKTGSIILWSSQKGALHFINARYKIGDSYGALRYRPKSKSEYHNIVRSNDLLYSDHLTIIYAK